MRAAGLIAALALAPAAGLGEIAPEIAETLTICATPGQSVDAVLTELGSIGWLKLPPQDRARAGLALAPYQLVFVRAYGLIDDDWDPIEAGERLAQAAEYQTEMITRDLPGLVTLVRSTGEILQVGARMTRDRMDQCVAVLPGVLPEDVAAHLSLDFRDISRPPATMFTTHRSGSDAAVVLDWLSLDEGAFLQASPPPLLSIVIRDGD